MAEPVQSFQFQPGPAWGRNNWTLDGGFLTRNGELFSNLDTIEGAGFSEAAGRQKPSAWLELKFASGCHRIACNMPYGDENHAAFMQLATAILDALAERDPDMRVSIGGGVLRWLFFWRGPKRLSASAARDLVARRLAVDHEPASAEPGNQHPEQDEGQGTAR